MNKFISLLSTGLDSPVAAYLMIKKNFSPVYLSFLTFNNQNEKVKKSIVQIIKILSRYATSKPKVYFIKQDSNLDVLKQYCERKLTCVLCKRLMIRIALEIAKKEYTNIIVTGDILGEQASQTLDNIYTYNNFIKDYLIIRPLIGWDKLDVINLNKKIGLFEISSKSSITCHYNPKFPETHAKLQEILNNESKIETSEIIRKTISSSELFEF